MGALVRHCENLSDLSNAMEWAYSNERTTVLSIITDPTHGHQAMQIGMLAFPKRLKDRKFLRLEKNMIKLEQNKE